MTLTQEEKETFVECRGKGYSLRKIALIMHKSLSIMVKLDKDFRDDIVSLKKYNTEALREKYFLETQRKTEMLGSQVLKMHKELAKRSFSDVQTEKLLEYQLKYLMFIDRYLPDEQAVIANQSVDDFELAEKEFSTEEKVILMKLFQKRITPL